MDLDLHSYHKYIIFVGELKQRFRIPQSAESNLYFPTPLNQVYLLKCLYPNFPFASSLKPLQVETFLQSKKAFTNLSGCSIIRRLYKLVEV